KEARQILIDTKMVRVSADVYLTMNDYYRDPTLRPDVEALVRMQEFQMKAGFQTKSADVRALVDLSYLPQGGEAARTRKRPLRPDKWRCRMRVILQVMLRGARRALFVAPLLLPAHTGHAAELRVLGTQSIEIIWKEVGAGFERKFGHKVTLTGHLGPA